MKLYVGLDVSLATTAICVIDEHGRQVKMICAASDPQAIAAALRRHAKKVVRIVLESGQLSTWLTRELRALDLPVVCVSMPAKRTVLCPDGSTSATPPMPRGWRSLRAQAGSARFTSRA